MTSNTLQDSLESWREIHNKLTIALAATQDAIDAEKCKQKFLLEHICANLTVDGQLARDSKWSKTSAKGKPKPKVASKTKKKRKGEGGEDGKNSQPETKKKKNKPTAKIESSVAEAGGTEEQIRSEPSPNNVASTQLSPKEKSISLNPDEIQSKVPLKKRIKITKTKKAPLTSPPKKELQINEDGTTKEILSTNVKNVPNENASQQLTNHIEREKSTMESISPSPVSTYSNPVSLPSQMDQTQLSPQREMTLSSLGNESTSPQHTKEVPTKSAFGGESLFNQMMQQHGMNGDDDDSL